MYMCFFSSNICSDWIWYNVLNSKPSVHQVALGTSVSQAVEKTGRKTESTASTGAPTRGPGELLNSSARRKAAIWHQFPRMSLEDMFWREWVYMTSKKYGLEVTTKKKRAPGIGRIAVLMISRRGKMENPTIMVGMRTAWKWLGGQMESGMTFHAALNATFYAARGNAQVGCYYLQNRATFYRPHTCIFVSTIFLNKVTILETETVGQLPCSSPENICLGKTTS